MQWVVCCCLLLFGWFKMDKYEIVVLRKMDSRKIYGSKHIRIERVMKSGFLPHEYGDVKKAILSLIKQGFIVVVNKSKRAIQLNIELSKEINRIIK